MSTTNNFGRAFDLSTLKNPVANDAIHGLPVNQKNLIGEFLPISNEIPVIIICWSAQSRQSLEAMAILGKLFEQRARENVQTPDESERSWLLGNLNVDKELGVVKALQIPSVPFALALVGEQVVPLFDSLPTEEQVVRVVNRLIELAAERGVGRAPTAPVEEAAEESMEPEEERAIAAIESGKFEEAKAAYKDWLARSPGNSLAELGLAQVSLLARIAGVDAQTALEAALAEPLDLEKGIMAADIEISQGNYDVAFTRLINIVRSSSGEVKKAARDHLVILFGLLDPADPLLIKARQQLASALF